MSNRGKDGMLLLSIHAWKAILLDAYQRREIEACGALLGRRDGEGIWCVEEATPLRNISASPVYFEFDPTDLLAIDLEQPGRMVGVYHSHPTGPDVASSIDRQNMQRVNIEQQIPWVWLIVSGPFTSKQTSAAPANRAERDGQATISASGVVAYHHQDTGLRQITIQLREEEDIEPSQRL